MNRVATGHVNVEHLQEHLQEASYSKIGFVGSSCRAVIRIQPLDGPKVCAGPMVCAGLSSSSSRI